MYVVNVTCIHVYTCSCQHYNLSKIFSNTSYVTGGGVDYGGNETQYLVTFPVGTNCSSVNISINDDNKSEDNETFNISIVSMSLPFGVVLGGIKEVEVVITDNDSE